MAIHPDGIWINFRDCEYYQTEPGETILFVPYHEIAVAKKSIVRYSTPDSEGGSTQSKDIYLDLELETDQIEVVQKALLDERKRTAPARSYLCGLVQVKDGKNKHMPVELEQFLFSRGVISTVGEGIVEVIKCDLH